MHDEKAYELRTELAYAEAEMRKTEWEFIKVQSVYTRARERLEDYLREHTL